MPARQASIPNYMQHAPSYPSGCTPEAYAPIAQYATTQHGQPTAIIPVVTASNQQYVHYVQCMQPYTTQPMFLMSLSQQVMTTSTRSQSSPVPPPSSSPTPLQNQQPAKPCSMGLYVTKKHSGEDRSDKTPTPGHEALGPSPAPSTEEAARPVQTYVHNPYALPASSPTPDELYETEGESDDSASQLNQSNLTNDSEGGKKKRKRKKKIIEDNKACDALRFKTRMCKNWETTGKCPYGPRCLFAHGKKELRSYAENNQTIITAARTRSPTRNFFTMGRFPSFIPIPHELLQLGRDGLQFPASSGSDLSVAQCGSMSLPTTPASPSTLNFMSASASTVSMASDLSRVPSEPAVKVVADKAATMTA